MRHKNFAVLAIACMAVALYTTGCGETIEKNKPLIIKGLELAGKFGADRGLKEWAKKQPDSAKETAEKLNKNLKEEILPWLDGEGKLKSSAEVNEFINSSLFKDLPGEVKDAIVMASAVLDVYLPIPSADKMNEDTRDYLKAFLSGLQQGAQKFLDGQPVSDGKRSWLAG
jgi:hypothetical protein